MSELPVWLVSFVRAWGVAERGAAFEFRMRLRRQFYSHLSKTLGRVAPINSSAKKKIRPALGWPSGGEGRQPKTHTRTPKRTHTHTHTFHIKASRYLDATVQITKGVGRRNFREARQTSTWMRRWAAAPFNTNAYIFKKSDNVVLNWCWNVK